MSINLIGNTSLPLGAVLYLRSCWLKVCFCSAVTWAQGNPGVCSVSLSHWDSRAGQCLLRLSSTSEKCSVRLLGDSPPTAWERRKNIQKTNSVPEWKTKQNMGLTNWGGRSDSVTSLPAERSLSGAFHPSATHHQMRACLYTDSGTLTARNRVEKVSCTRWEIQFWQETWCYIWIYESLHIFFFASAYKELAGSFYCGCLWKLEWQNPCRQTGLIQRVTHTKALLQET